jgi:hypothetical protein
MHDGKRGGSESPQPRMGGGTDRGNPTRDPELFDAALPGITRRLREAFPRRGECEDLALWDSPEPIAALQSTHKRACVRR